jgi:probable rRNA maturation factor
MIQVQVNHLLDFSTESNILKKAAQVSLEYCQPAHGSDLTILVTIDDHVRELNFRYRNIDASTDVLSFSSMEMDPDTNHMYLGDVVISYEKAVIQAGLAGHEVAVELQLLVVHGVLHLLGFDHGEPDQKIEMWELQEKILEKLGLAGIKIISELG